MTTKQYGLIIPKKSKQTAVKRPSVFDNDSEEEKEGNTRSQPAEAKLDTWKSKVKKKTQLEMKKVLEEDPTIYEYDSIYDNMQKEKAKAADVVNKSKDRKPRYIESLLKAADSRKKEYERRVERTIQKEREEEGDEFKDKEAFVTSAYKKKMQEMQEQEEKERKEREAEERMDVKKQKDLSGFYRHLLKQTAGHATVTITDPKEPVISTDKQNSSEKTDNSPDNKQSAELIRAKKAVEELKKSSERIKENLHKKRYSDNSDEEGHKSRNHTKNNREKLSGDETSDDSSNDESHKRTKRKHKSRHENSHKHKKSKSRHHHSDSEEETKHSKKHRHSKHKSSHRDDKQRKDRHRVQRDEKHKRSSRHSSDSDSH